MIIDPLIGPCGNVPILIRDDDTNFFTKANMIEAIYSKAWEEDFKVSLSVVPCQKCTQDNLVPPEMRKKESLCSVADNKHLITFLKSKIKNKSVEILQHGFSHASVDKNKGEFGDNFSSNKLNIRYGRDILREAFEVEPRFFVPPGEDISGAALEFVSSIGQIPIYRRTDFDKIIRSSYIPKFAKQIAFRTLINTYKKRYESTSSSNFGLSLVKPVIVYSDDGAISWSLPNREYIRLMSLDSLLDLTSNIIERCSKFRIPVCILNHYYIYFYDWNSSITNTELFRTWHKILESFAKLPFGWKVSFSDLYDRIRKIHKVKIIKTGSKITIESKESIEQLSFRIGKRIEVKPKVSYDNQANIATIESLLQGSRTVLYEK
jgi:Uncharacterized protein conserved in bacteria (DUF2334)